MCMYIFSVEGRRRKEEEISFYAYSPMPVWRRRSPHLPPIMYLPGWEWGGEFPYHLPFPVRAMEGGGRRSSVEEEGGRKNSYTTPTYWRHDWKEGGEGPTIAPIPFPYIPRRKEDSAGSGIPTTTCLVLPLFPHYLFPEGRKKVPRWKMINKWKM